MKLRVLTDTLKRASRTFPALVVTGPRQSGKTTLLKAMFGTTHSYFNLEDSITRLRAQNDPDGFLAQIKKPVILDEFQYVPQLLSSIKSLIDENRKPGQWILTGSQNFVLMENVSESLAGRAAILTLPPFMISEALDRGQKTQTVEKILIGRPEADISKTGQLEDFLLRGFYPEVNSQTRVDRNLWCGSYITTYLERDVRNLKQIGDLHQFEIFLRSLAVRTGQTLDLTDISRDIGVSLTTVKRWLSILETGYQVFLLYPYYRNIGKRLLKRPKIYFADTGLASYLMGIHNPESLFASAYLGPLFETMVVIDFWKRFVNFGQMPSLYYLKTRDGLEIDLVIELKSRLHLIEIKSSQTITPAHTTSLVRAKADLKSLIESSHIISNSSQNFVVNREIKNLSWRSL